MSKVALFHSRGARLVVRLADCRLLDVDWGLVVRVQLVKCFVPRVFIDLLILFSYV